MKTGIGMFYAVGVGPGDPAWMTRQACDVLGFCPVIAAPRSASGEMPALEVARGAVDLSRKSIVPLKFTAARARSARNAEYVRAASSTRAMLLAARAGRGLKRRHGKSRRCFDLRHGVRRA